MKHLLTIAALMLSMSSAAQNYEIVPDIEGQTSEYRDGKQVTTVTKDGVTLSVTLSKEKNSYGKFYQSGVMLVNASGETFTFDPKDIVVKVIDKYDNVKDMGVYSSDEYARKVTRNQDWTLFFSRVFDAMASDARYIASTDGEILKALQSGSLKSETDGYLKKNTLHSGERLAGFVNIGYSKGRYMLMRIPVGGRDFVFRWKL